MDMLVDCVGLIAHLGTEEYRATSFYVTLSGSIPSFSLSTLKHPMDCAVITERCRSLKYEGVRPELTCSDVR